MSAYQVDRRPLLIVLFSRMGRLLLLLALAAFYYWFSYRLTIDGLNPQAQKAIGAFFVCLVLWVSQLIPLAITGLLAIVIIPLSGVITSQQAYSYFGNQAVFFILGAFILSAALLKTGLSVRMAVLLLKNADKSPNQLVWRILLSCFLLSCVMPEHAVAAIFLPIIFSLTRALEYEPFGGSYGRSLFMAMAWGCVLGGTVTLLGGARAPLALGFLEQMAGQKVSFFEWMKTTIPVMVVMLPVGYFLIVRFFKVDVQSVEAIGKALVHQRQKLGLVSWRERWVLLILVGAVFLWVFYGHRIGHENIAMGAAVALFLFRVVRWSDLEKYVNWGIILMYGGAICLGKSLESSQAIDWLASHSLQFPEAIQNFLLYFGLEVNQSLLFLILVSFIALVFSELVSNAAVVAILMPLVLGLAPVYELNPVTLTYAVAIPAGLASLFPISTPAVALAYSSGYLKIKDLFIPGLIMNFFAWLCFVLVMIFLWPYLGYV